MIVMNPDNKDYFYDHGVAELERRIAAVTNILITHAVVAGELCGHSQTSASY